MSRPLPNYETDEIIDTLRECRAILRTEDLLDDDIAQAIKDSLNILGVEDDEEN